MLCKSVSVSRTHNVSVNSGSPRGALRLHGCLKTSTKSANLIACSCPASMITVSDTEGDSPKCLSLRSSEGAVVPRNRGLNFMPSPSSSSVCSAPDLPQLRPCAHQSRACLSGSPPSPLVCCCGGGRAADGLAITTETILCVGSSTPSLSRRTVGNPRQAHTIGAHIQCKKDQCRVGGTGP